MKLLLLLLLFPLLVFGQKDTIFRSNPHLVGAIVRVSENILVKFKQEEKINPYEIVVFPGESSWIRYRFRQAVGDTVEVAFTQGGKHCMAVKMNTKTYLVYISHPNHKQSLAVKKSGKTIDRIAVRSEIEHTLSLVYVPLKGARFSEKELEDSLNYRFRKTFLRFDVTIEPPFQHDGFKPNEVFANPSPVRHRYASQMIHLRELFLSQEERKFEKTLLFFEIAKFRNKDLTGYMVKDKALGFVKKDSIINVLNTLENELLQGYLDAKFLKNKQVRLVDLSDNERYEAHNLPQLFSFVDDYEDVKTNNGLVAYYLFEVDKSGNLIQTRNFLHAVERPIKKNTFSYHLEVNNVFYKPLFTVKSFGFNLLHLISFVFFGTGWFILGRKIRRWFRAKLKRSLFIRFLSFLFQYITYLVTCIVLYIVINLGYKWFEVRSGEIVAFSGMSKEEVVDELTLNTHPDKNEEPQIYSEIIVKRGNTYSLMQREQVLYFTETIEDSISTIRFTNASDSIHLYSINMHVLAKSHYMVLTKKNSQGKIIDQRLYNHLGVDLTNKLELEDPPKRILVFVNGYRPTSMGASFEENFNDIQNNGLEYPNSLNRLFTYDRYNYWHPWNTMDDHFKERINPIEVYYADGHHSVSTSNHRSLLKFTTQSTTYPKRCKKPNKHVCYISSSVKNELFGTKQKSTYELLATRPNRKGFKIRMNSGRIAGRNMYQLLNELPNTSKNDTLFLVVHSMGFAYAQGMIDYLRGKMQFGSYYIIAPENASSGKINTKEWQQIWQYGSNLKQPYEDAPCLQDGVAPQTGIGGLPEKHRIFIPEKYFHQKGYFDSHFIGYYRWIFDLPAGNSGYVQPK